MENILKQIRNQAEQDQVPIMSDESLDYICAQLSRHGCFDVLECGTAIGYSALYIANCLPQINILSLEKDESRYKIAIDYITQCQLNQQIHCTLMDATQYVPTKMFDACIIDAAKAQNKVLFDRFFPFVKPRGIVIVDNMNFHGHVENIVNLTSKRNLRQMMNKIKQFEEYIASRTDLKVSKIEVGDGLLFIKRL